MVTVGWDDGTTTVMATVADAVWLFPKALKEIAKEAGPGKPGVGVNLSPFRAAFRFASVPLMVIVGEAAELDADVLVTPFVVARVSVPWVAVTVSCWVPLPAFGSVTLMAFPFVVEKTNEAFSLTDPVAGAVIVGPVAAEIVNVTGVLSVGPVT